MPAPSTRRRLLRRCGVALAIGLAGCTGSNQSGSGPSETADPTPGETDAPRTPTETPTETPTDTGTPTDTETGTPTTPSPTAWHADLGSSPMTPAIADAGGTETAYVGTHSGTIHAFSLDDGSERWSFDAKAPVRSTPVVVGGTVLVVVGNGRIGSRQSAYALDAASGETRWHFQPGAGRLDVLGAADGRVYVGSHDDAIAPSGERLYAVSHDDGTEQWSREIGDPMDGLAVEGAIYVASSGRLYAYDVTGERRWTKDISNYTSTTLAATDGTVVYAVRDFEDGDPKGAVHALDAATGEESWSFAKWFPSSTVVHDGTLYVGGEHVAAFDPGSGETQWQAPESGYVGTVGSGGVVYAGSDEVHAHAPADGSVLWSWGPDPAVDGAIPAGATAGTLYVDTYQETDPRNRYKFAVETDAGDQQWAFEDGTELTHLAVGHGRAVVGNENGAVYGLD